MALPRKAPSGPRIVVLGGGNGTSHVLQALVPLLQDGAIASLHAVVHTADDGGSTGRLRKQYAVGAMGDLTKCLLALSRLRGDVRGEKFLRALEYRFTNGDFSGHTLRNALLAALEITSDLDAAIATFARVLQIPKYSGVIPATLKPMTQQVSVKANGETNILGEGQYFISWNVDLQTDSSWKPEDVRVTFAEKDVVLNPRARQVLENATHVIVAPGHTYGSILPTLASLSLGSQFSIKNLPAKFIVVMTLLTTPRHTTGWSGEDFVRVYESYLERPVDVAVANTGRVDIPLADGQEWVTFQNESHSYELVADEVVSTEALSAQAGDVIQRAIVVHNPAKLRTIFWRLMA